MVAIFELGEFISQNRKPIASYSRKLINPKKIYTVTKRELLSIF